MPSFNEIPIRSDVPDASESRVDCPGETAEWQDSIELPDDTGEWQDSIELPDDTGEWQNSIDLDTLDVTSSLCESAISRSTDVKEMTLEEQQEVADAAAQEYNDKYHPCDRAIRKGVDGVSETKNGGVSFENSSAIYVDDDGNKACVSIEATGNRTSDFDAANRAFGLSETPDGYVWHHVDDYDVKSNTITMQLVKDEAHNATKPHSGGCAQYDAVNGPTYNPPRKEM